MGKKMPADPIKRIDDIHYIQAYIKAQNKTHSHRNYILFILGITTGYRVGDLVTLRVKDIKRALSYGYFQIEEGKTKKIRKVPIVSNLKKELKDYIKMILMVLKYLYLMKIYHLMILRDITN